MNFILLIGPPAVGKMTVGQELSKQLAYPLCHNHHSIELALDLFAWGTPEFKSINSGIRHLIFDTVLDSKNLKGFIFTLVVAFDIEEDVIGVQQLFDRFVEHGWQPILVELYAPLDVRQERNPTPNRLKHKASKRHLKFSADNLTEMEGKYKMTLSDQDEQPFSQAKYLRLDNRKLSAAEVAKLVIDHFQLQ